MDPVMAAAKGELLSSFCDDWEITDERRPRFSSECSEPTRWPADTKLPAKPSQQAN